MKVERTRVGWNTWLWWVLANSMGWVVGGFVVAVVIVVWVLTLVASSAGDAMGELLGLLFLAAFVPFALGHTGSCTDI